MASRLIRLGDALSQFFNVLLFNGDPNYSISGDSYRYNIKWRLKLIDWLMSPFEDDHCRTAYFNDIDKARNLLMELTNDNLGWTNRKT